MQAIIRYPQARRRRPAHVLRRSLSRLAALSGDLLALVSLVMTLATAMLVMSELA